jgi:4,5-DOPA dioxygenase extradiol
MPLVLSYNHLVVHTRHIYFAVILVSLSIPLVCRIVQSFTSSIWQAATTQSTTQAATIMSDSSDPNSPSRTPVYFLGIGGPNFMENTEHPAYAKLAEVGREITTKVKPKAVVIFSAHWQDGPNKIKINVAEQTDIIYDFYGFPPHYYEYPNKGSPEVAEKVIEKLAVAGIDVERVKRGLDHGVWAGFIVGKF